MKLRKKAEVVPPEIDMTPMIDMVFQLLIFFMLTFKIVAQEGDFSIKMPLGGVREGLPSDDQLPPMKLRLSADGNGRLASIKLNDKMFVDWQTLHRHIINILGDDRGPGSIQSTAEVEFDCDYKLKYVHVVDAITAVSGYVDKPTGTIVKLVEKIKFAPPKGGPS